MVNAIIFISHMIDRTLLLKTYETVYGKEPHQLRKQCAKVSEHYLILKQYRTWYYNYSVYIKVQ